MIISLHMQHFILIGFKTYTSSFWNIDYLKFCIDYCIAFMTFRYLSCKFDYEHKNKTWHALLRFKFSLRNYMWEYMANRLRTIFPYFHLQPLKKVWLIKFKEVTQSMENSGSLASNLDSFGKIHNVIYDVISHFLRDFETLCIKNFNNWAVT